MRALLRVPKRLVHQKLPHGSILTQYNGALVCRGRILASLHAREKVRGERPIRLIASDRFWRNRAQHSPSCPGAARFRDRSGASYQRTDRWRETHEPFVEKRDRLPVRGSSERSPRVHRLDRGLELEWAHASFLLGGHEKPIRLRNHCSRPASCPAPKAARIFHPSCAGWRVVLRNGA